MDTRSAPASGPLLLAVESATRVTGAAVLRGEALVAELTSADEGAQAERLLPAIDGVLRLAGASLDDLDGFAVSIGPGSFTSLRIAVATVKGLAFRRDVAVAPVSTLAALAQAAALTGGVVVPLLDARRGELYAAAFAPAPAGWTEILREGVYGPEELEEHLPVPCTLAGEGAALVGARLRERRGAGVRIAPPELAQPRAFHVGVLGARMLARGEGIDAARLVPRYVRRAEAEVKRTGRRFEAAARPGAPRADL